MYYLACSSTCADSGMVGALLSDWTHLPVSSRLHSLIPEGRGLAALTPMIGPDTEKCAAVSPRVRGAGCAYKYSLQPGAIKWASTSKGAASGHRSMISVRRMLQQALRVSGRSAFPLVKWMERWAEGAAAGPLAGKTLGDMPGPTGASFAWDLFAKRGLSRLHDLQVGCSSAWRRSTEHCASS